MSSEQESSSVLSNSIAAPTEGSLNGEALSLPSECFLLRKQNVGFQIPYFLSNSEELSKVRPPAVVKTWEQRFEELTEEQRGKFNELKELAKEKPWYDEEVYDDWCLLRYLTARSFNPTKALQQLENTVTWRKDPLNNALSCSICEENPNLHCGQFAGWDLEHRPVMFMSMRWGPERKNPLKHMVAAFNHMVRMMPVGVEKWVCVTDFETYSHLKDSSPSMGSSVINTIQDHFPERLAKMVCINPPTMFWVLWKLLSPVVDPVTREKVAFLYTETTPSIYDAFPSMFPEHMCRYLYDAYDHSKYCIEADPLVWTPSASYPKNYDERKVQLKTLKSHLEKCKKESKARRKAQKK